VNPMIINPIQICDTVLQSHHIPCPILCISTKARHWITDGHFLTGISVGPIGTGGHRETTAEKNWKEIASTINMTMITKTFPVGVSGGENGKLSKSNIQHQFVTP
jgi:hypothetical protein